jgi:predicted kinase
MNRLILIRGPICAGKSTTAISLQNSIEKCSLVDQDCLKRMIDKKDRSDWRRKIAFDTTLYLANSLMQKGRDIIADVHSSVPDQYEEYKKLAAKHNYKFFSFLLYPPLHVCQERNKKRDIPDVKYKLTDDDIKHYWENLYEVENEIIIDSSTMDTEHIVDRILKKIER